MGFRRPHLTRTAIGLLAAVAFWLVAMVVGLGILQLPSTRAWLAREIARRLSDAVGQPARVAGVRLSVSPPAVVLKGVEVGAAGRPMLQVAVAEVMVGDVRLATREIGVDLLRLKGVRLDAEAPSLPMAEGRSWVHVLVRQLDLEDVQVRNLALPAGMALRASDVEVRWNGTRRNPISAAVVHLEGFSLSVPGVETITGSLAAWGRKTPEGWQLGRLRGRGDGWAVEASGVYSTGVLRGDGKLQIELAALDRALALGAGLAGEVSMSFSASQTAGSFRVDASLSSPLVTVAGFPFEDLEGEAHASPDGLEASLEQATFAGGELAGSYQLASFGPPWHHRVAVRGEGVEVAGFLHRLGADDAGLSGRCRVNADVSWEGSRFKQGDGTAIADVAPGSGEVAIAGRIVLTLAHDGALGIAAKNTTIAGAPVRWQGTLALGSWRPAWRIAGEKLPIPTIARMLRGWVGTDVVPAALHGEAAIDIGLSGPFSDLSAEGKVALAPVAFGPVEADGLEASFRVGQGVLAVEHAEILVGDGRVGGHGELRYGAGNALHLDLVGKGVPLARMVAWGGVHAPLAGRVNFTGSLDGTLSSPRADAQLRLAGVAVAGVPFGEGGGHVWLDSGVVHVANLAVGGFDAAATIDLARREAVVDARLSGFGLEGLSPPLARLVGGALDCTLHGAFPFDSPAGRMEISSARGARGEVELDARGLHVVLSRPSAWRLAGQLRRAQGEFHGKLQFGVESWRLVAQDLGGTEVPVDGTMTGEAELRLAPPHPALLDGVVSELVVEIEGERASLKEPAHFRVEGSALRLDGATMVGPRSTLFVRGGRKSDGALFGNVSGELPAALLGLVWRAAKPSGRVELLGEISGTDTAPRFEGVARVADGSLRLPGLPAPLTRINGVLELTPDAVHLAGVGFSLLGGDGTCNGRVMLSPTLQLDLEMQMSAVRWPLIAGLTPSLTGQVRLVGGLDDLSLTGKAVLQRTVYRRPINLQKLVIEDLLTPERARAAEGSPMALDLAVDVPGTFEIDTPLARLVMGGEIRVVGTTARYGVLGRLEALPGGELELADVRYELDRGVVSFSNANRFEPRLDLLARTTVQTFEITVGLTGTLDRLIPTFSSNPPLPDMDVISLLSVGRRADQAGQAQAGAMASSFLTEQLTGAVTHRARTLLDVDQLHVDPFAATQSGSPTARLTVVKQLSHDWTVTLSTNLASNREEIVTSRWRLGQGVYLEANRDVDGAYALDIKWQRRF